VIPEIDIWRVPNLMLKRYGDRAFVESARRADEVAAAGDTAGVAVWSDYRCGRSARGHDTSRANALILAIRWRPLLARLQTLPDEGRDLGRDDALVDDDDAVFGGFGDPSGPADVAATARANSVSFTIRLEPGR
jgi:hypothetical protein